MFIRLLCLAILLRENLAVGIFRSRRSKPQYPEPVKNCNTCQHFILEVKTDIFGVTIFRDEDCYGKCTLFPSNDKEKEVDVNFLVTGKKKIVAQDYRFCATARSFEDMCGEKGKLHKPIE